MQRDRAVDVAGEKGRADLPESRSEGRWAEPHDSSGGFLTTTNPYPQVLIAARFSFGQIWKDTVDAPQPCGVQPGNMAGEAPRTAGPLVKETGPL
ncbi:MULTISPECIES: hypothetical protein [unclassified Chelatococcus]|uniref:hypothetical protein n=1 Tax=unclassified Chelatococcus TaxID=2638111 RepID=UPI001BCED811|nr:MULTISPECIES: hypothetical protein [unclassified Chelatococcus]MBS7698371.1 hypothetical protein [Chelatococcus sp. YT9]MBX3558862.1 hypothetical protein [Chelatococcus sp.]